MNIARQLGICAALTAALGMTALGGCAMGPVSPQQRADAATDYPLTQPRPPSRLAGVPLDGSFNKLYCTNDGPNTICNRQ